MGVVGLRLQRSKGGQRPQLLQDDARGTSRGQRELLVHGVAVLAVVVGASYLIWRAGWTINSRALWLAIPLLVAETHGYLTLVVHVFMTWTPVRITPGRVPAQATVDFFIPTYNEPFEVLAPTVAAAVAITYPHKTFVLDDGRRPWVKRLCRRLGASYVVRADNVGAKAGNLNHAMRQTNGQYVAVVDADFVPSPTFISDLIGYFDDRRVGFVQAPQEFYNLDSFQHLVDDADGWHEQATFFRLIQLGKNRWNAGFWCGSPSMLRRTALNSIGGIAEETITEDLHTSIRMHAAGWRSVFHPSIVALGIAPNDYDSFIMQRLRWAQGAMQVLNREWRIHGLSLVQRINYAGSTGTYFDSLRKAMFLAVIPAVIITDRLPIAANAQVFLLFWACQFVLGAVTNSLLGRGSYRFLPIEFFDFLKMFAFIRATPILLSGKPLQFRVTPKGRSADRRIHPLLAPHVALVGVYVGCAVLALARVLELGPLSTHNETAMVASGLWALAVLAMLSAVVLYGYRHISQRRADRVPVFMYGTWRPKHGKRDRMATFRNLTLLGCGISIGELERGTEIRLNITGEQLTLSGTVVNIKESAEGYVAGVRFDLTEAVATQLAGVIAKSILTIYAGVQPEDYGRPVVEAVAARKVPGGRLPKPIRIAKNVSVSQIYITN